MRAYLFDGRTARLTDVPDPVAGPGQVVLRVLAAGLCHSDLAVMRRPLEQIAFPLPVVLGHEACGVVVETGEGVEGVEVGDQVAVHGPRGCGRCALCREGSENYCRRARALGIWPIGLGSDGALADLLLVHDPGALVPLHGLDPVAAAPLTDAGLTPFHAVRQSLSRLGQGSTAVVIGVGGLGHLGVQILRAVCDAHVVAVDRMPEALDLASSLGAHDAVGVDSAEAAVLDLTGGTGADVVLDFVGSDSTLALAGSLLAQRAELSVVGLGGGSLGVGLGTVPLGTTVRTTFWGSRSELVEVIDLAREGSLRVVTEQVALSEVAGAYERLEAGDVRGRLVVVPG